MSLDTKSQRHAAEPGRFTVAVLLATYNGEAFLEQQIRSLAQNETKFTLHWIDDHSTDNTRDCLRLSTGRAGIDIVEWHRQEHEGVPNAFFWLLENVEADIYLFCDQDDIWEPGKIDAAVADLSGDLDTPVLSFTDPWLFRDQAPGELYRLSQVRGSSDRTALLPSRLFMTEAAPGHTQSFTRPLRDLFLAHKDIARSSAFMHDVWIYGLATYMGRIRLLTNSPTTRHRVHCTNATGGLSSWRGTGCGYITVSQRQHKALRKLLARHATGLLEALKTLPLGPKSAEIREIARLVSSLDRRQSLPTLARMLSGSMFWPNIRLALGLATSCLCRDARE